MSCKSYLPLVVIAILAAAFLFGALTFLVFRLQPPLIQSSDVSNKPPTLSILLYVGEISSSRYGFGESPNTLTSPGPTLRFATSDVVNITVVNVGDLPHAFAITSAPVASSTVLFNAEIGSAAHPLQPGQKGSVIFAPNNAGASFYYISQVHGSVEAGMYGSVIINGVSDSGSGM